MSLLEKLGPTSLSTGEAGSYLLSAEAQAASETVDSLIYCITFWQLIWRPALPVNDTAACKMQRQPSLITDAKGLYDLLLKPELQPASGADKRTSIEVLVTQDKLSCSGAKVQWVSSELQFADGMTKAAAAQLLAERLRVHSTSIKPDETFTAAKKKDATARKKSAEQFAIKRPQRALQALMASAYLAMVCDATNIHHNDHINIINNTTTNTAQQIHDNEDNTIFLVCMAILVLMAIHDAIGLFQTMWRTMSRILSSPTTATAEMVTTNVDDDPVHEMSADCPQCAILEVELAEAQEEIQRLNSTQEEFGRRYRDTRARMLSAQRHLAELQPSTEFVLTRSQADARLQWATQRDAYFTRAGEVWRADSLCGPIRNCNGVISKRPCQLCVLPLADESTYRRSLAGMRITQYDVNEPYVTAGSGARP